VRRTDRRHRTIPRARYNFMATQPAAAAATANTATRITALSKPDMAEAYGLMLTPPLRPAAADGTRCGPADHG